MFVVVLYVTHHAHIRVLSKTSLAENGEFLSEPLGSWCIKHVNFELLKLTAASQPCLLGSALIKLIMNRANQWIN